MRIKEKFVKTEIADDLVVLVPIGESSNGKNFVIELNETAALIYDSIADGLDEKGIAALLVAECSISPEKAAQDVKKVIEQLTDAGAIENRPA